MIEPMCVACKFAWGEGTILYCGARKDMPVYVHQHCDRFDAIKPGEIYVRPVKAPPEVVYGGDLVFKIDGGDNHLIHGSVVNVMRYVGDLDVVIDLGAHVGTFSLWCARRGANVYAYEPSEYNHALLLDNIAANELKGCVFPIKRAVTDVTGETMELRRAGVGSGQRSLYYKDTWPVECSVQTVSLKDVLKGVLQVEKKIDYLKCDIEGSEVKIIESADDELIGLIGKIGFVDMSVHPLDNQEYFDGEQKDYVLAIKDFLEKCGLNEHRYVIC